MNRAEDILQRAGLDLPSADPLLMALEAACHTAATAGDPIDKAAAATNCLPPNATSFERGLAFGLAFALTVKT